MQGAISSINVLDPTSEISRYEDIVRREEAQALGQAEVAASSIDAQFAELETSGEAIEIEARLAALKHGTAPASQVSPTQVTPAIASGTTTQDAPTTDW